MSTRYVKVGSSREAWDLVRALVYPVVTGLGWTIIGGPGSLVFYKDQKSSETAGYDVFRLDDLDARDEDAERLYYNYVSDLGGVLELNTCGADWSGDVYRIVIDSRAASTPAEGSETAPAAGAAADSVQGSETGAAVFAFDDDADQVQEVPADDPRPASVLISDGLQDGERITVELISCETGELRKYETLRAFLDEWAWWHSGGRCIMNDDKIAAALRGILDVGHGARVSIGLAGFELVFTFYRWPGYDRFMRPVREVAA